MKIGITGLKYSGKTTIFTALTGVEVGYKSYQKEPNRAVVKVPDERLDKIAEIYPEKEKKDALIDFVDIVEFIPADKPQKGFSTETINNLKYCDEILAVIRAFDNLSIPSPIGKIDINEEYHTLIADLLFSDNIIIENRLDKLEKNLQKRKDEEEKFEYEVLKKCLDCIESNKFLNTIDFSDREEKILRGFQFLTEKPIIFALNISEKDVQNSEKIIRGLTIGDEIKKYDVLALCGELEKEINQLNEDEKAEFIRELGIKKAGINRLIKSTYKTLDLISFFTVGENEVKAWTVKSGTPAVEAAGEIHTDIQKGFIKAEVVRWDELVEHRSMINCREKGILRTEGKNYQVQDGDVIYFKFNV